MQVHAVRLAAIGVALDPRTSRMQHDAADRSPECRQSRRRLSRPESHGHCNCSAPSQQPQIPGVPQLSRVRMSMMLAESRCSESMATTAPMLRQQLKQEVVEPLEQIALQLFAEQGYREATIGQIVEAAGRTAARRSMIISAASRSHSCGAGTRDRTVCGSVFARRLDAHPPSPAARRCARGSTSTRVYGRASASFRRATAEASRTDAGVANTIRELATLSRPTCGASSRSSRAPSSPWRTTSSSCSSPCSPAHARDEPYEQRDGIAQDARGVHRSAPGGSSQWASQQLAKPLIGRMPESRAVGPIVARPSMRFRS